MNEIIKIGLNRFVKGVREAPREFLVPAVVVWRGVKFIFDQVDTAMGETRDKSTEASISHTQK